MTQIESTDKPTVPFSERVLQGPVPALLLGLMLWYVYQPYTVDDAFISYRYAENFAAGNGLVYNVGERVEGYTNFLWVMLLAIGPAIGIASLLWSKILGAALTVGVIGVTYSLARRIAPHCTWAPAGSALLAASCAILSVSGVDGLETELLTFLLIGGTLRYLVEIAGPRRFPWSALIFLAAGLTRPDGCLFFAVIVGHRLLMIRRVKAHRYDVVMLAMFIVPGLAYFFWRYQYYGYPLPNTFYAKGMGSSGLWSRGWGRFQQFLSELGYAFLLPAVIGVWLRRLDHRIWLIVSLIVARWLFAISAGGAWMGYHRFFAPTVPLIFVLGAIGVELALRRTVNLQRATRRDLMLLAIACGVGANLWYSLTWVKPPMYAYAEGLSDAHVELGRWLGEHAPRDAVLACGDAGALPYYSGLTTIDTLGLNDEHIAHLPGAFSHKDAVEYVFSRSPDYVVVLSSRPDRFVPHNSTDAMLHEEIVERWQPAPALILSHHSYYYLWLYVREGLPRP